MEEAQSEEASRGITNGSAHIMVAVHGVRFVSPSVTPYTSLFSLSTRVCLQHLLVYVQFRSTRSTSVIIMFSLSQHANLHRPQHILS